MSTPSERCTCCDLPVSACGVAAEIRQRTEARANRVRLLATPGWIAAAYPGACASCQEPIKPGEPIAPLRDALAGWVGACCEEAAR